MSNSAPTRATSPKHNKKSDAAQPVAFCSVFPKIGIARVGDSEEYFIGPESPGVPSDPEGGFKDSAGRVKRQAVRFRVYGFDAEGNVVCELTTSNTQSIAWRAAVANKKASWHEFAGGSKTLKLFEGTISAADTPPLRNNEWPSDRRALIIKATATVSGPDECSAPLEGTVYDLPGPVYLGEMRTDHLGRLLFLGGHGHSRPTMDDENHLITHYANNDGWSDDTADGPVLVEVTLQDGTVLPLKGHAWVLVAPPDFSPHTDSLVTLYDVMEEAALEHALPWHLAATAPAKTPTKVSFLNDIYPILSRAVDYQWVNERALRGHGPGKRANFLRARFKTHNA